MATIAATVNTTLPGSIRLAIVAEPLEAASVIRRDGVREAHPVRNVESTGLEEVIDCEAPLGRPVTYSILDATGKVIATSSPVTCPAPADGRALLRSVLYPNVKWMWCRTIDNTGLEYRSSTQYYDIVGSDTPVIVSEMRQRPTGTLSLYAGSIEEADEIVELARDGTALLIRFPPCAGEKSRDMLFYALNITENRWGRGSGRVLNISYQSSVFVPGRTLEPASTWTFESLKNSADDFESLAAMFPSFQAMALNLPRAV
jgi:hypothetical protein